MDNERMDLIEKEIEIQQRNVSYDTKEYTIELIVSKYLDKIEDEQNEFFVPDYQREFVWDDERQSRFIESLMMGLPIPYLFLAENSDGRYEIVDGSQRIRTLSAFLKDELVITNVDKIKYLNGMRFSQLKSSRQRKFKNISLKMIVLSERTTDETKNDIFERINRGSDLLKDMEKRKGIYRGEFNNFLYKAAKDPTFIKLTPVAYWFEKRQEREELLLRFFAFSEWYPKFNDNKGVARLLDEYMEQKNKNFSEIEKEKLYSDFKLVLKFATEHYDHGFAKNHTNQISRVYFEALSVGTLLALREKKDLQVSKKDAMKLITDQYFLRNILGAKYHTHKAQKICSRIDYIKNGLLKYAK